MKTLSLSNQLVRIARMLEAADEDWWSLFYPWEFDLIVRCMAECSLFDNAPKFSNSLSAVKGMKHIYRVPCTYSFSEEFDENDSEINLLTLKVNIPHYKAVGLATMASEDFRLLRASDATKQRIETEDGFKKRIDDKFGEVNRDNLIALYDASMLELSEFRTKIESGVADDVKGKFPYADVSVLEDAIYNAGESYKFKGMNRSGDLVGEMKLTPNPITIEILGLKNRGELDSARSLINKLMRSLGVERV